MIARKIGLTIAVSGAVMRMVLSFVSMLAVGWLAAVTLSVIGGGTGQNSAVFSDGSAWPEPASLDLPSLFVGMSLGVLIATLGRIRWGELPRQVAAWLVANQWRLRSGVWALLFLGVLLFY